MSNVINSDRDLFVYQKSFSAGKRVFDLSRAFPREEMYSLTDQIRRSSRSVSANLAEAWRKRRYEKHFCSTLNIAEAEAAETQVWLEYAAAHGYLDTQVAAQATQFYEEIIRMIVRMISDPSKWCMPQRMEEKRGGMEEKRRGEGERGKDSVNESPSHYEFEEPPCIDQSDLLFPSPPLPISSSPPLPHSPSDLEAEDA